MLLFLSSTTFFSVVFLLASSGSVYGWGFNGHALVARIAQTLLTDESTTFVRNHLPANVSGNMSMLASWADFLLYPDTDPDYLNWQWSKQLHYVDTEDWVCVYDREKDCNWTTGQRCVDGAIQNYTGRLADSGQDDTQRQEALQFLIHFIGDAHQPLHAGFYGDIGGNAIHGHFFGKSMNLHSLWDTGMIERRISQDFNSQPRLYFNYLVDEMKNHYAQNISDWTNCSSSDETRFLACSTVWIQEDAEINCNIVYLDENDQRITPDTGFNLSQTYFNTRIVTVEQRLIQAGVRLATVINKIVQSTTNDNKSNTICIDTTTLMIALVSQSVLVLALLYCSFLRRKPTTIIQPPVSEDKKEYFVNA